MEQGEQGEARDLQGSEDENAKETVCPSCSHRFAHPEISRNSSPVPNSKHMTMEQSSEYFERSIESENDGERERVPFQSSQRSLIHQIK